MKRYFLMGFLATYAVSALAQSNPAALAARQFRQQHERAIIDEFFSLLSLPNISSDKANIQHNAEFIAGMMQKRGVPAKLVSIPGANPVVFGEIKTPGASRTIVFYAHYDGQPLDPKEWATPPFQPTLRSGTVQNKALVIALPQPGSAFNPEWRRYHRLRCQERASQWPLR
jgi:hypothetical protein